MKISRRETLCGLSALGGLSLFNVGCAGFGQSRTAQLAAGGKIAAIPVPDNATLEQEELRIIAEFLSAVRGRPGVDSTGLDFSIPLVKTLMLSNMLVFAGKGTYQIANDKTSSAVANTHAKMTYRKGWEVMGIV